jgi:hypothetical protein
LERYFASVYRGFGGFGWSRGLDVLRGRRGASRGGGEILGLDGRAQVGRYGSRLHSGLRQSGTHPCRTERGVDGALG